MADAKDYPDRWREYCKAVNTGRLEASEDWNQFAARYRAASAFFGTDFMGFTDRLRMGYSSGVRLLLAYSAFESCCRAKSVYPNACAIEARSELGKSVTANIRKHFNNLASDESILGKQLSNPKLRRKLRIFFDKESNNLQPVAAALRHLLAHGNWTPTGGRALTKGACETLDSISRLLLYRCDEMLAEHLLRLR